jgi:hypothetical protein
MSRFSAVVVALAVGLAVVASSAGAQVGSPAAYSTPAGQVQSDVSGGDGQGVEPRRASAGASSHLPFTGLDVGLVLGVGLGLLLVGVGLSRLTASAAKNRDS